MHARGGACVLVVFTDGSYARVRAQSAVGDEPQPVYDLVPYPSDSKIFYRAFGADEECPVERGDGTMRVWGHAPDDVVRRHWIGTYKEHAPSGDPAFTEYYYYPEFEEGASDEPDVDVPAVAAKAAVSGVVGGVVKAALGALL